MTVPPLRHCGKPNHDLAWLKWREVGVRHTPYTVPLLQHVWVSMTAVPVGAEFQRALLTQRFWLNWTHL